MTKDKSFNPEYARELLKIAHGDLESAQVLASIPDKGRKENICFTAQQSIEKSLKAVLCAKGEPVPMTHSIELILDRLGAKLTPPGGQTLIELTDFATVKRYQEGEEILSKADIEETIRAAQETLAWAQTQVTRLLKKA